MRSACHTRGVAAQLLFMAETLGSGIPLPDEGPVTEGDNFVILALVNAAQVLAGSLQIKPSERLARIVGQMKAAA